MWPQFDGWCASRNVEPLVLDPDRFCNLVEYWWTRNMNEERQEEFNRFLAGDQTGSRSQARWSREAELAQFRSG
jgi:hypothetical protein